MIALVTGATGLVGSHVAERLLEAGCGVRALVRAGSETAELRELGVDLRVGDLSEASSLRAALRGVDVVHHSAAVVGDWGRREEFLRVGQQGTENLLRAAVREGVARFVHMSSASVYGLLRIRGRTVREDWPLLRRPWRWDHYGRAKIAAERVVWDFARRGELGVSVLRPTMVCGRRDRAVFPRVAALLRSGRFVVVGSGRNPLHVVAARDVAEAAVRAGARDRAVGQAYNIDGPGDLTQRAFVDAIADLIGAPRARRQLPLGVAFALGFLDEVRGHLQRRATPPGLTRYLVALSGGRSCFDLGKARQELGWAPRTPVLEALEQSHAWWSRDARGLASAA